MKLEELSAEDQALVKTEFSPELEKEAAEHVKLAQELYTTGFSKLAQETADELDKLAAEGEEKEDEKKEEGKELSEEQKKEASVRGAFIAQGFIDGLKKLGQERHNDELAYLYPFVNEKLANMGKVMDFARKGMTAAKDVGAKAMAHGKDLTNKAVAAAKSPAGKSVATHTGAAVGGALGLKGLQMMGRKKEDKH